MKIWKSTHNIQSKLDGCEMKQNESKNFDDKNINMFKLSNEQ